MEQHRFFCVDSEVELLLTVTKFTKMGVVSVKERQHKSSFYGAHTKQ